MALKIDTNINVDFYDKKYIMINAKQYDSGSRWIAITCYNDGDIYNISSSKHSAYIRYRKSDGNGVLNSCRINNKGEILVELTEQMLAADGICYVDLIIVNKGSAIVNVDTGEIITIDDSPILSTMAFCVNVYEVPVDNSEIESSYEYDALNDLMQRAEAEYTEVIRLSKSYAVGDAGDMRENENFDNSKYYCEQASISADNAKTSEENASESEHNAATSEQNAAASEQNAAASEANAAVSETNASTSEANAAASEANAKTYMDNARISETNSYDYSITSQRYAVGGTNTVSNEDIDNAKYYYEQTKGVSDSVSGSFSPKGTVSFEDLATVNKFTGDLYVVEDSFITDSTFVDGEGVEYPAGTIVYYTVDGLWACFDGFRTDIATVSEVMNYLGL
jgi:hypothetical protein